MPNWLLWGAASVLAAYAVLSHWLMVQAAGRPWAVAALFGPLLLAVAAMAIKRRHPGSLLGCLALALGLALVVWRGGVADVHRLYVAQHAGIHLALCWTFAITLRRGSMPLISALAQRVHGRAVPEEHAYTRRLTVIWALYFIGMAGLSVLLYVAAPWSAWSVFANLLTPLAALGLFVGEHLLRYRLHPEFHRATLAQSVLAYRRTSVAEEVRR